MKELPGYFIGVVLLMLLALTGTSAMTGSILAANARDFHASVIRQVEDSNFNPYVMDSLYEEASQKGYELAPMEVKEIVPNRKLCEVILSYEYPLGILGGGKEHFEIRGYAR